MNGSAMSSADGVTSRRLSRNVGTRARTLRRNAIARVVSDAFAAPSVCCSARYRSHDFGRPGANELLEPADGVLHHRRVAALGGQPGTLDEHRGVLGLKREQLLEQALRLGVGISPGGVLDLLNERRASVKTSRVELDGAAELGDRLVTPSA